MLGWLAVVALQAAGTPQPPESIHGGPRQMTCPVGGERFDALVTNVYSTYGTRPDGRPNTYWLMPLPIPECPSNGLVVFQEFTPQQVAALTPLIASAEYRRLVAEDTTYYRAQWLATRIGVPEQQALWLLLSATWQVKPARGPVGQAMPSPVKTRQYQEEFVARVRALPPAPAELAYVALFARATNAERELGHFESAAAMLTQMRPWVTTGDPSEWEPYVTSLAAVVARRDSSAEPLDMVNPQLVPVLCLDLDSADSEFNRAYCARPELQQRIEEIRRLREDVHRRMAQSPH